MDSLDLLKSLTKGVNNKISQEQESSVEYIVSTSLRNKNKKSTPPIVKEVSKPIDTSLEENILEEEIVEDIILDFDDPSVIEEKVDNPDDIVVEDVFISDDIIEESIVDGDITSESIENGHILEELPIVKKEVHKIQRNGNPFKRGPRKKKLGEQSTIEEPIISIEEKVEEVIESKPQVEIEKEMISEPILDEEVNEVEDIDFSEGLAPIEEIDFASIFDDISEEDEIQQVEVIEKEPIDNVVEDKIEDIEVVIPIVPVTEVEEELVVDVREIEEKPIVKIEPEISVEEKSKLTEVVEEKVEDVTPIVAPSVVDTEEVSSEDEKFKNCIYYKGMPVEEFLRANPDYRETLFVEHFYKKEELQELLISGKILVKKGKYRL